MTRAEAGELARLKGLIFEVGREPPAEAPRPYITGRPLSQFSTASLKAMAEVGLPAARIETDAREGKIAPPPFQLPKVSGFASGGAVMSWREAAPAWLGQAGAAYRSAAANRR